MAEKSDKLVNQLDSSQQQNEFLKSQIQQLSAKSTNSVQQLSQEKQSV